MATINELKAQYEGLDQELPSKSEEAIDPSCLLTFQYEYPDQQSVVEIDKKYESDLKRFRELKAVKPPQ